MSFIHDDFSSMKAAKELYHNHADSQPIIDFHSHLPEDVAEDKKFENLYDIWLAGDHYKWRHAGGGDARGTLYWGCRPLR